MGISCRTYEDLPSILADEDVFIHCAGKTGAGGTWEDFVQVNRDWAVHLYDQAAARHVRCFIHVSSVAAMGYKNRVGNKPLDESSPPEHAVGDFYGRSKLLAEQALQDRAGRHSTRLIVLRPGLIYGHRPASLPQTWLRRGTLIDPRQRVPLVHIDNFIEAVVRVADHPEARGVFLVVDNEQPSVRDLNALKIQHGLLRHAPWNIGKAGFWLLASIGAVIRILRGRGGRLPKGHALAQYRFFTRRLLYCTDKLRAGTGWMPAISLGEGLAECARRKRLGNSGH